MEYPNWFMNGAVSNFERFLPQKRDKVFYVLQIGVYTGDSSCWLIDNVIGHGSLIPSYMADVDTWQGSEEDIHKGFDWEEIESIYDQRISEYNAPVAKFKMTSDMFFRHNSTWFDFIYIDGSHEAVQVLKDAVNAFDILNPNGIIAFDDYGWTHGTIPTKDPKPAIDAFLACYADKIEVLEKGYQVWVRKISS